MEFVAWKSRKSTSKGGKIEDYLEEHKEDKEQKHRHEN